MRPVKLILRGTPVTKKNSQRILRTGSGRPFIQPSAQYKRYEADCLRQIPRPFCQQIDAPVNVQCVFYMPTCRRCDLVNLLESVCDILVRAGVLADDNCRVVAAHDGSCVRLDRDDPRVEIDIVPWHGETI